MMTPPPLQDLCSVRYVVEFCMQPDVKEIILSKTLKMRWYNPDIIKNIYNYFENALQAKFLKSMENCSILLRNNMPIYLIPLIGIRMIWWTHHYWNTFHLEISYCINFMRSDFFTSNGALKKELAAIALVKDESLSTIKRLKIACGCFLTEYIPMLWEKLNEDEKFGLRQEFVDKSNTARDSLFRSYLPKLSTQFIDKKENEVGNQVFLEAFTHSFRDRSGVSCKYSFDKLNKSNKDKALQFFQSIFQFAPNIDTREPIDYDELFFYDRPYFEIIEHLILKLPSEQLHKIFLPHMYYGVLNKLLLWPYQYLFIRVAKMFWENIKNCEFNYLLHSILNFIAEHYYRKTFNYKLLLKDFWKMGSSNCKNHALSLESEETFNKPNLGSSLHSKMVYMDLYHQCSLLTKIFFLYLSNDDVKFFIKMIFNDASADVKQKILVKQGDEICESALNHGKFEFADLFVKCFVPTERINEFKRDLFDKRGNLILEQLELNNKINRAVRVVAWFSVN